MSNNEFLTPPPKIKINLGDKPVRCPLCYTFMLKEYEGMRRIFVLACHKDRIAINANDPFVGRWEEALENVKKEGYPLDCPVCGTEMRFFCTSTGYMRTQCPKPKCRVKQEITEPDRAGKGILYPGEGTKKLLQ